MTSDSIRDTTRYVVSDVHHGNIMPGNRMEMWRDVYLLGGADVRGSIWCGSLSVSGPGVQVSESIYCRGAASVAPGDNSGSADANVTFSSCFTSPDSLVIQTPGFKVRFLSDIYTGQLNIENAFVYGNIFADRVTIRNSIILGGLFCNGIATIERSLISTFNVGTARLGKNVSMFFPFAMAKEKIELEDPVRVLTFYSLQKQIAGQCQEGEVVLLNQDDIVSLKISREQADGEAESVELHEIQCLSMTERILDTVSVYKHLEFNRKFIQHLSLGQNMDPTVKAALFGQPMEELESVLWTVLESEPDQAPSTNGISIKELFSRFQQ